MPTIETIKVAIEAGDATQAQAEFDKLLAKNDGRGISGEDQAILRAAIGQLLTGPEATEVPTEAPTEPVTPPKAKAPPRQRKAKE